MASLFRTCFIIFCCCFIGCTAHKKQAQTLSTQATPAPQATEPIASNATLGYLFWDADSQKPLAAYHSTQYFTPASNTKLLTTYLCLQNLPDSLPAFRYSRPTDSTIILYPIASPVLLHPSVDNKPVLQFLQQFKTIILPPFAPNASLYRSGWAWNDYMESYMLPLSACPLLGNTMPLAQFKWYNQVYDAGPIKRDFFTNKPIACNKNYATIPFIPDGWAQKIWHDTLHIPVQISPVTQAPTHSFYLCKTDTVLKNMLVHSDNFLAEQLCIMANNQAQYPVNIDSMGMASLSFLPQAFRWVDGSGLSRYNLTTPQNMVLLLQKMITQFGKNRLYALLPKANEGTLKNMFTAKPNTIAAKSGSMGGVYCLTGFFTTPTGKTIVFSVMMNNAIQKVSELKKQAEALVWKYYNN